MTKRKHWAVFAFCIEGEGFSMKTVIAATKEQALREGQRAFKQCDILCDAYNANDLQQLAEQLRKAEEVSAIRNGRAS